MEVCLHSFVGVPADTSVTRAAVQELDLRQALALLDYFGKWFDIYRYVGGVVARTALDETTPSP